MKFWDLVVNEREETVYSNVAEGLERLPKGQVVIHVMYAMLKGHLKANPYDQPDIR